LPSWLFKVLTVYTALSSAMASGAEGRFLQELALDDARMVVVAEAEREPRSIGSYSIRLYAVGNPEFPYDDFVHGLVVARDGFVEKILLEDLDADGSKELVVLVRSAGTGGYLSAQSFKTTRDQIYPFRAVADLPALANPLEQLRQ